MTVRVGFTMKLRNRAQAVLLLELLEAAGAKLEDVTVETDRATLDGREALNGWREHARKKLCQ